MALPPPICIYSYILLDDMTPLTYFKTTWNGSAWVTPPVKVFDSTPTPANFVYIQGAGFTADGTHLGIGLSHSVAGIPPDATTLDFLGDGLPASPVDLSSSNTLGAPWLQLASFPNPWGSWFFNGAYYQIAVSVSGTSPIRILTSATGSNPWTELDAAHHPVINAGSPQVGSSSTYRCTISVPSKIDFFFSTPGQTQVFLQTFDLLTRTWGTPYGLFGPIFATQFNPKDVVRFPNGDIAGISLVQVSGNLHWSYRIWNGTSWSSEIMLTGLGSSSQAYQQAIIDPATPEVMLIWKSNAPFTTHDSFSLYTATHTGVVTGPIYTTRTINDFSAGGMGHGTSSGGVQYVPITDTNLTTAGVWIGSGASLVETQLPVPPGDTGIGPEVPGYMVDILAPALVPTIVCPVGGGTATIGVPFSVTLTASGGTPPYTFFIVAGALPPGLSLNSATGVISGTPLVSGTFTYTAEVIDANGLTAQVTCTITIPPIPPTPLGLLCPTTTTVLQGQAYSFAMIVIDGTPPFTFALISGALPPGLSLNTSTGVISGTATASGTYTYQISVTDANGNVSTTTCVLTSSQCPGAL